MVGVFSTGEVSGVGAFIDDGYLDHQGLQGQPLHGPEGFVRVVQAARRGYRLLRVTVEDLVEEENWAAARLRWHGVRPDGEVVERETLEIVHVREGRAIEHWGGHS
jgi:hypothetical protein